MNEVSKLLKVDTKGRLIVLDIKREDGQIVIPGKEWECAVIFTFTLSSVNNSYLDFLQKVEQMNRLEG